MLAVEKRNPAQGLARPVSPDTSEREPEMKTCVCAGAPGRRVMPCAAVAVAILLASRPASAGLILPTDVTLQLADHPDGNAGLPTYGLRLDELIDVTAGHDRFTFSFEHPSAMVQMLLTEVGIDEFSIHIWGTAFGGLVVNNEYDPLLSGLVEIDFTYVLAHVVDGDDDLIVTTPSFMNTGSIMFQGSTIDLFDRANKDGFTFRLGNEDDDMGHRGFDGISGWGWLDHGKAGTYVPASDWLFTVVPTPGTTVLMAIAAALIVRGRRRRRERGHCRRQPHNTSSISCIETSANPV